MKPKAIDKSPIQWTGPTWNPWQGCHKVSAGCANCYMFREMKRYGRQADRVVRSAPHTFNNPLRWQREVDEGIRAGQDRLVFTCSWSDWFIEEADAWRNEAWDVIRRCPDLVFQILTKRPELIDIRFPAYWDEIKDRCWIGATCENQELANLRIPQLLKVPASVRFLSLEPLLGPIDLRPWINPVTQAFGTLRQRPFAIKWVIVGGESGPGARPCSIDWIRSIVRQCEAASVPVFVKQLGRISMFRSRPPRGDDPRSGIEPLVLEHPKGGAPGEWPEDVRVRQFPAGW